ncbi:MAG: polysaccharide pyruvyl transferase family protein, partial [Gemmatimonadetes bacterium]|nr:polysaccharide pyruvyl transferase family protein [Gemmatimonadota bacterium]
GAGAIGGAATSTAAAVQERAATPGQILSLLEHFEFTVGMRLHFLIFSALAGVPLVGLPYAPKVTGFLEEPGLETPALTHVSAGQLIARIDRAWDRRQEIRARIRSVLPALRERARRNNEIAVSLLTRGRPGERREAADPPGGA